MTEQERIDAMAAVRDDLVGYINFLLDGEGPNREAIVRRLDKAFAVLPPDWCGHEATIARLQEALDAHHRGLTLMGDGADKCAMCAALAQPEGER